ncbi:MAG: HlyD family efflux transporter periplasmic adaptor subunit [Gemmatimonadales bacterium]
MGGAAPLRDRARRLDLELRQASARLSALRAGVTAPSGALVVQSPCDGMLIRLHVRATGAVVQQGDVLADLACTSDSLIAEVQVPASGIGRVQTGQTVRLLYDAFPYQRYGVRFGELTWVGASSPDAPFGTPVTTPPGFLARVRPDDSHVRVDGVARPLVPGMGGSARIVVARRRLVSYAFEPLAQLREAAKDRAVPPKAR